jgi:hypothetical protein
MNENDEREIDKQKMTDENVEQQQVFFADFSPQKSPLTFLFLFYYYFFKFNSTQSAKTFFSF